MLSLNWHPSDRDQKQFVAIWLPAFFLLVGGVLWWRTSSWTAAGSMWAAGGVLSVAGLSIPALRRPLYLAWMCAAYPIGWTVSHVILLAVFYLVITPLGLVMRLFGRDPMQRVFDRAAPSYWVPHDPATNVARYFRQY